MSDKEIEELRAEVAQLEIEREAALELLKLKLATIARQANEYDQLRERYERLQDEERVRTLAVHSSMTKMLQEAVNATT